MSRASIGIIGGTGLGEVLLEEADGEAVAVDTPFGAPSCRPILAQWEGVDVAFIARHGHGHRFNPSSVPYRANILALKMLGVHSIIASGATGSLREEIHPGELVICDQVIDKTSRRTNTFFDEGPVAHVEMADPFCPRLCKMLVDASEHVKAKVHASGTYVCMEGPQFSTRAESQMHRQWGADVVGMTCMPEAKLAREAELCYALIALPTDYDCWKPHSATLGEDALLAEIKGNLKKASQQAIALIRALLRDHDGRYHACHCHAALKLAIWSDKSRIDGAALDRLAPLIGRYMD